MQHPFAGLPQHLLHARNHFVQLALGFIEQFFYWKSCGGDLWSLDAKSADAILLLQEESVKESKYEEK